MALFVSAIMGISLAAVCGLRAFLPLLVVGISARMGILDLNSSFEWLSSTPAILTFAVAVVLELLSDKFPVIDNLLDTIGTFVKPVAATILFAGIVENLDPLYAVVLGIIAGGTTAFLVHAAKAKIRLASTTLTLGAGNVLLSILEDIAAIGGSVLAIAVPIAAVIIFALTIWALFTFAAKLKHRRTRAARGSGGDPDE